MKLFDFSSPYSRATLVESMDGEPSYAYTIDATATEALPWKLKEPPHLDFGDFSAPSSGIPNFREPARFLQGDDAKAPCFTVYIDPTVPGADVDYRGDLFGEWPVTSPQKRGPATRIVLMVRSSSASP